MQDRDDLIKAIDRRTDELDVGPLLSDGDDFQVTLFRRFGNPMRITIVDADNGRATRNNQILEQTKLGGEVGFDAGVVVEVISRQVGKSAGRDAHAVEAMLVEAVRRRFKREMCDSLLCQSIERAVWVNRDGWCQRHVAVPTARSHT